MSICVAYDEIAATKRRPLQKFVHLRRHRVKPDAPTASIFWRPPFGGQRLVQEEEEEEVSGS